ncbi:MAG TPA: hypothetical protein V6C65_29470, partial [Allocoleopsis sp.]
MSQDNAIDDREVSHLPLPILFHPGWHLQIMTVPSAMNSPHPTPSPRNKSRKPRPLSDSTITLAHGSGGTAMRDLIHDLFVDCFDNPNLTP